MAYFGFSEHFELKRAFRLMPKARSRRVVRTMARSCTATRCISSVGPLERSRRAFVGGASLSKSQWHSAVFLPCVPPIEVVASAPSWARESRGLADRCRAGQVLGVHVAERLRGLQLRHADLGGGAVRAPRVAAVHALRVRLRGGRRPLLHLRRVAGQRSRGVASGGARAFALVRSSQAF